MTFRYSAPRKHLTVAFFLERLVIVPYNRQAVFTEFTIMNCKAGQTGNVLYIVDFKKMKIEEKKVVHSLIFFFEEATTGGVL